MVHDWRKYCLRCETKPVLKLLCTAKSDKKIVIQQIICRSENYLSLDESDSL